MTDNEKQLVKDVLRIQKNILIYGITPVKQEAMEKKLMKLGYTPEEIENIYFF